MDRFFTPLLRRVYLFFFLFLLAYSGVGVVRRSDWNKERLLKKLLEGNRKEKVDAAYDLIGLQAQPQLVRALRSSSPLVRQIATDSLWTLWLHASGEKAFRLTEAAGAAAARQSVEEALKILTELTRRYPEFAEGWNRRATLYWQIHQYTKSIADCRQVVALNPDHFGAWQGMGMCQMEIGDVEGACHSFRRALRIMPHNFELWGLLRRAEEFRARSKADGPRPQLI